MGPQRSRYLPTPAAAAYLGMARRGLLRAWRRGDVKPSGQRGRVYTWDVDELDRFARGKPIPGGSAA